MSPDISLPGLEDHYESSLQLLLLKAEQPASLGIILHFHLPGALATGVLPRTWVSFFQMQATGYCAAKDLLLI